MAGDDMEAVKAMLESHDDILQGLSLVVLGDQSKGVHGLIERTDDLENFARELRAWRQDINTALRVGLVYLRLVAALLVLLGIPAWEPLLAALIRALGG